VGLCGCHRSPDSPQLLASYWCAACAARRCGSNAPPCARARAPHPARRYWGLACRALGARAWPIWQRCAHVAHAELTCASTWNVEHQEPCSCTCVAEGSHAPLLAHCLHRAMELPSQRPNAPAVKSLLLQACAGIAPVHVTGEVTLNGKPLQSCGMHRTVRYVDEEDRSLPQLTVRETLLFSSTVQGPRFAPGATCATRLLPFECLHNVRRMPDSLDVALRKARSRLPPRLCAELLRKLEDAEAQAGVTPDSGCADVRHGFSKPCER
jgi:hypothetical protein